MLRSFILLPAIICLLLYSDLWAAVEDEPWCREPVEEYKLIDIDDLDEQFVRPHYDGFGHDDPGKVIGDFNGDGLDDCAVLYVGEADDNSYALLSVTFNYDERSVEKIFRLGYGKGLIFISPVEAGTELSTPLSLDTYEHVKLLYTGIRVTYSGKAEVVYYWSDERQAIWTIQTVD